MIDPLQRRGGRAGLRSSARPGVRFPRTQHTDRAMVTAELALGVGSLVILVGLLVGVFSAIGLQLGCQSAATEIARQEARGDTSAVQSATSRLPHGSTVGIRKSRGGVSAEVRATARPWGSRLPGVPVTAKATMLWEPGAEP